jgi:hypothetical protein
MVTVEAANSELGQPADLVLLPGVTCGKDESNTINHQPTPGERERLDRRPIHPLRVIDEAEERAFICHLRQQI